MHHRLIAAMRAQPQFDQLLHDLPHAGQIRSVAGLPGSSTALLMATLAQASSLRRWLLAASSPAEAEAMEADLQTLLGPDVAVLFPQRETLPYEAAEHHVEVGGMRVEAVQAVLAGHATILVTTHRALQELAILPSRLDDLRFTVRSGDNTAPTELAARLGTMGFRKVPIVEGVGEFTMRGGIVDVFGFGAPEPVRIEFWGDEIVSMRRFDILDQRSTTDIREVDFLPVDLQSAGEQADDVRRPLVDVLSRDTTLLILDPEAMAPGFVRTWQQVKQLHRAELVHGRAPDPPSSLFLDPEQIEARLDAFPRIVFGAAATADIRFDVREAEPIDRDTERLAALLRAAEARGEETVILCDNAGQLDRLEELITAAGGAPGATLAIGGLTHGFVLEGARPPLRVLTDHEIFRRARRLRRSRRFRGAVALESLSQLRPGDFVVHLDHGVGRFTGMQRVTIADEEIEALALEYANGEILRVPVYRLDLIERWVPDQDDAPPPKLHRIGGKSWKALRKKTELAIREMAAELLRLYAQRQLAERTPYAPDSRWQKEMESGFLYEDTPDQRKATTDVKRDMESRTPMDRLLCGDVGYGKTEIAIRAAFKAVQDGRQVAVLAPTTILVEQHLRTFRERLAGFPVRTDALSRFRNAREQQRILAELAEGRIDIIVGTHRIVEPDVTFHDLGLLIIDEEQRFGVKQKERFKELKHNLDVLSLTATPIPRTLHLSLTGLRDLSLLQTPPRDRMPIITHVLPWVDEIIEDAIHREFDRGGQVFVVHNRVHSILGVTERIKRLAPGARVALAHGQMPATELDDVMRRFIDREVDILVTTAIIENGLDVPNANTLIVDRADLFGLAQLYQIRGRVGRSHHRAYCYLLIPEGVTPEAERRLRILEQFTDLGSGYAVALKDLELRGAGNILGAEQSGFVHAVGLDTYTRLLEENIRKLREGDTETAQPTEVAIEGAAYLPDDYIADPAQKLHLYRRLSRLERPEELEGMRAEFRDRFGPLPPEADRLLGIARLKLLGTAVGADRITIRGDTARLTFRPAVNVRLAALQRAFADQQVEVEVRRTDPLSMVLRRRGAADIQETLGATLRILGQARDQAA